MTEKMISSKDERLNTIIGQGTVLKGECSVKGTVRVDGVIDGCLIASGVAILGKSGCVKGDMKVQNAIVGGKVEGNVIAQGRLELQTGANVQGDVAARKLIVEEGVFFDGSCSMETEPAGVRTEQVAASPEKKIEVTVEKEKKIKIEESGVSPDGEDELTFRGKSL